MITLAPGMGNEDSLMVSGTWARKPLSWASRCLTLPVYHESAFPAGRVAIAARRWTFIGEAVSESSGNQWYLGSP